MTYAPPRPASLTGADGTCESTGDNELVQLDARQDQPGFVGVVRRAPARCSYEAVTSGPGGGYAVLDCGTGQGRLDGSVTLVHVGDALAATRSWPIGRCGDGSAVSQSVTGDVLLSAYLYCPRTGTEPVTVLDLLHDGTLRRVASSGSEGAYRNLAL